MIFTLFQVVEQQSQALQALISKVDAISQITCDLSQKVQNIRWDFINIEKRKFKKNRWISVKRKKAQKMK